jgi:hypothetical protein
MEDKRLKPIDKFNYNIGIDDINEIREQGFGMHESKRMLMLDRLTTAIGELDIDKRAKHILIEILTLIK